MKEVTIKVPDGKRAEWQEVNGVQTLVLVDEKPQNVMERVKTFDDAVDELEERRNEGDEKAGYLLDDWYETSTESDDLNAYLKLRIITYALNEGWEPKYTQDEYRWFPWYWLKTKEEIEELCEEEKKRVVGRASDNAFAYGGLVFAYASHASSSSNASYGSRLAFKSKELAEYAGMQFREIYADFCFRSE